MAGLFPAQKVKSRLSWQWPSGYYSGCVIVATVDQLVATTMGGSNLGTD